MTAVPLYEAAKVLHIHHPNAVKFCIDKKLYKMFHWLDGQKRKKNKKKTRKKTLDPIRINIFSL